MAQPCLECWANDISSYHSPDVTKAALIFKLNLQKRRNVDWEDWPMSRPDSGVCGTQENKCYKQTDTVYFIFLINHLNKSKHGEGKLAWRWTIRGKKKQLGWCFFPFLLLLLLHLLTPGGLRGGSIHCRLPSSLLPPISSLTALHLRLFISAAALKNKSPTSWRVFTKLALWISRATD